MACSMPSLRILDRAKCDHPTFLMPPVSHAYVLRLWTAFQLICHFPGSGRPQDSRGAIGEEQRQKPPGFRDDSLASQSSTQEAAAQSSEGRNPLGAIGNDVPLGTKAKDEKDTQSSSVNDPLAGMAPIDKWGIKGLRTLMNNYPDYQAAITGMDPQQFGLNLQSTE